MGKSDCVLIDLRSDLERGNDGIPELKFVARDKVAAIPFQTLAAGTIRQVASGATKLQVELTSLIVANLAMIKLKKTKVYLMAGNAKSTNGAAKDLARKLRKKGCRRPYIMEGGFREWEKQGLPVVQNTVVYQKGTVKVVADRAEVLASN